MFTDNFPDISFIDNETIDELLAQMISDFQDEYKRITGKERTLAMADPYRLLLYAASVQLYQGMQYADRAGKMSFLTYARGDYLDNLAALRGIRRTEATAATTILRFSIDSPIESAVSIPAGCRVTNSNDVYFATDEYAEIKAGGTEITVPATCTAPGLAGNGIGVGELNVVVNTLAYIVTVTNTVATTGGADREEDDDLKERVYESSNAYSTAGPIGAYEYHTKMASPEISDVRVGSKKPGEVDIYFVCDGGKVPDEALIRKVKDYLDDQMIRPLTDKLNVAAPSTADYTVSLKYYISSSNKAASTMIQEDVKTAVSLYNTWQTERIGRDINPSYLIQKVMEAGAKRVDVTSPTFQKLDESTVAKTGTVTVTYGGVEDD